MKAPDLFVDGKRIDLLKRIGKGGEGEVWLMAGEPKRAVKYYTLSDLASREAKVREMAKLGLADTCRLVAYPRATVTTKTGRFAGFTMSMVEGSRQIHELYGVKSRKIHYPNKDYRFLVRAAANTARAVAQVHASPCIIGDLNHSGFLVANDATVALIDADSFQLQAEGKTYPCLVGVPEFTPPELQGKSLNHVVRTKLHDQFGLAVAIFQLLCMGRHPYAGRYQGPDLTLDQFIARNLFAYSLSSSNGVTPPSGVVALDAFPQGIITAFEYAFGTDPSQRPTAAEWVGHLQALEGRLSHCATDSTHYYPSSAKACPWCKMEAASGAILFVPNFSGAALHTADIGAFDVEKAWTAIKAINVPEALSLLPSLPPLPKEPSLAARKAKQSATWSKVGGVALSIPMVVLWINRPTLFFFWAVGIAAAVYLFNRKPFEAAEWQKQYSGVDRRYDDALTQWRIRLGHTQLTTLRAELERAVGEYKGLPAAKAQAREKLKADRRQRQLHDHLDRFLIHRASIPGIGPVKSATLRSFGIESAADVVRYKILQISGFGPATADKLTAWRTKLERRFVYNPQPTSSDAAAEARVEAEFGAKRASLSKKIAGGHAEMSQIAAAMQRRLHLEDARIIKLATVRAQLSADLSHLGISKQPTTVQTAASTALAPTRPAPASAGRRGGQLLTAALVVFGIGIAITIFAKPQASTAPPAAADSDLGGGAAMVQEPASAVASALPAPPDVASAVPPNAAPAAPPAAVAPSSTNNIAQAESPHKDVNNGIDCTNASSGVDVTVCSSPSLKHQEDQVASIYRTLVSKASAEQNLQFTQEQRAWVSVREACASTDCLVAAYQQRLRAVTSEAWAQYNSQRAANSGQ